MGDPRRIRKKYDTPVHPWQKGRIEEEIALKKEYGLKNKTEIWKMDSTLKGFKDQAKSLIAREGAQAEKEQKQLFAKLAKLGLLAADAKLDDILGLNVHDVMKRRLQTVVVKNGLARTVKQARQFIIHQHIQIEGKPITMPSYLVPVSEEAKLGFVDRSALSKADHPERATEEAKQAVATKAAAKETAPKEEAKEEKKETPAEAPAKPAEGEAAQ